MAEKRKYTKRARAKSEAKTRTAILDAVLALWAEAGPAATTVTAVAGRAGVQRLTVYRHYPDDAALSGAAWDRLTGSHPRPDPTDWTHVPDPARRLRKALRGIYAHYRAAGQALGNVLHEAERLPALNAALAGHAAYLDAVTATLEAGWSARGKGDRAARRLHSAIVHALQYPTWLSLSATGLSDKDAARLMERMVGALAKKK